MAFVTDHEVYDALPISNDALERGGVELLRAGVVDEELFITARRVFAEPAHWGYVLADITRRLATLYAAEGDFTEAKVGAAIAGAFARSLRSKAGAAQPPSYPPPHAGEGRKGVKPAKSMRPRAKARATSKSTTKAATRRQSARAKP
jgi:hypothetical protein